MDALATKKRPFVGCRFFKKGADSDVFKKHFVLGVFEEKQSADVCMFVGLQDPYLVGSLMITNSIAIQIYIYI